MDRRLLFYAWCLVACPLIGWLIAVFGTRGDGSVTTFVVLFMGLPAALALAGGVSLRGHWMEIAIGVTTAAGLGLLTWFLTLAWLASQGFFDS